MPVVTRIRILNYLYAAQTAEPTRRPGRVRTIPRDAGRPAVHVRLAIDSYYQDKLSLLRDVFGAAEVRVVDHGLMVDGRFLPVVDDVIVALHPERVPLGVRRRMDGSGASTGTPSTPFDAAVQYSFGEEWQAHPKMLPEYRAEFEGYFDLIDLPALAELRIADLGCGMGRWSYFVAALCREIVLVDFSESIFVARDLLRHADNAVFVMADVLDVPFRDDAFDLVYCLGVLHHLPLDALDGVRALRRLAPRHLSYLYYALDNRPAYFRWILGPVTAGRRWLSGVRSRPARSALSWVITVMVYVPLAGLGTLVRPFGLGRFVPLADIYAGKSIARLRQDAYDRFFTSIEQRFSREEIVTLTDVFAEVTVSEHPPYWHFLCEREPASLP